MHKNCQILLYFACGDNKTARDLQVTEFKQFNPLLVLKHSKKEKNTEILFIGE